MEANAHRRRAPGTDACDRQGHGQGRGTLPRFSPCGGTVVTPWACAYQPKCSAPLNSGANARSKGPLRHNRFPPECSGEGRTVRKLQSSELILAKRNEASRLGKPYKPLPESSRSPNARLARSSPSRVQSLFEPETRHASRLGKPYKPLPESTRQRIRLPYSLPRRAQRLKIIKVELVVHLGQVLGPTTVVAVMPTDGSSDQAQ